MSDSPKRWRWRVTIETEKPAESQSPGRHWRAPGRRWRFWLSVLGVILGILGIVTTLTVAGVISI